MMESRVGRPRLYFFLVSSLPLPSDTFICISIVAKDDYGPRAWFKPSFT